MKRAVLYTFALAIAGLMLWTQMQRLRSRLPAGTRVTATGDYHGWNALELHAGGATAVIVQGIGRMMDVRLSGDQAGPFWHDPRLRGRPVDPLAPVSMEFGGDNTWPVSPGDPLRWPGLEQAGSMTFDQTAFLASILPGGDGVQIEAPLDEPSGIKTVRTFTAGPRLGSIAARTTYYKDSGPPVEVAVRVNTRLQLPELVVLPAGPPSSPWVALSADSPAPVQQGERILVRPDSSQPHHLGTAARTVVWVGATSVLRVDLVLDREPVTAFPHDGCSVQMQTHTGGAPHVSLATIGPLLRLRQGDLTAATTIYTLVRRQPGEDAAAAAHHVLEMR